MRDVNKVVSRIEGEIRQLERERDEAEGKMARLHESDYEYGLLQGQVAKLNGRITRKNNELVEIEDSEW